jgi:superfamily II DNA or RNA helicase
MNDGIERILRSYPPAILSRGRTYASQGRVIELEALDRTITATVKGELPYQVLLRVAANGKLVARCSCPAFDREDQCKHIAAVALTVSAQATAAPTPPSLTIPPVFRKVYSTSVLLSRLALYARSTIHHDVEKYVPLADWWWEATRGSERRAHDRVLARAIVDQAPAVEEVVDALRAWQVPPSPLPKTSAFSELYIALARIYETAARNVVVGAALPGPLDDRHPGFIVEYEPTKRLLVLHEKPSSVLTDPWSLGAVLPFDDPGAPIAFSRNAFATHGAADAWDLFALRRLLEELHARSSPAVQQLERELDRPVWEHVLEHLASASGQRNVQEAREWRFELVPGSRHGLLDVVAYARKPGAATKGKWKRERFTALLVEEVDAIEREIGRLALYGGDRTSRGGGRPEPNALVLGTPLTHDLLRLLAEHPRVGMRHPLSPSGEEGPPARIRAGTLTMTLEPSRSGQLVPRFRVGRDLLHTPLVGDRESLFRWSIQAEEIIAVEVPPGLRAWLDLSTRLGDALAFPAEAIPKLASATQSLMTAGVVELPRVALGDELPYTPTPALRVEWKTEQEDVAAVVEVMIKAHPRAPFAPAGEGPKLFTFEHEGKRVYVERDLGRELAIAGDAVDTIDVAGIVWRSGVGYADGAEAALALASWLAANEARWPVEVKVGRPPVLQTMSAQPQLVVSTAGAWLRIEGAFGKGIKLTAGELLEAARLAQRYVRAGDGVFVELSKAALAKLRPIAIAAQLAPPIAGNDNDTPMIHGAFGALLADAADLFESVKGAGAVDLRLYSRRFAARGRRVRAPALEHGTLRDYQKHGVSWMLSLATWAPGCVLADDMGLGKTVQTAAVLKARAKLGPALVVSPASVSSNWVSELARFMPSLRVRWYNEERPALEELSANDVLVVSYGLLQREAVAFRDRHWATVVVDEAQYVKNMGALRSDAVRALPRDFTIALTGTPLENHLGELFSIVDVAFPGLLGPSAAFREHFRTPIEARHDTERLAMLGKLLEPFLLRRTRASVLEELPPRQEITEQLELSVSERRRYLALRNECEAALARQSRESAPSELRIQLLAVLTRLRQMACDVRLLDPEYDGPSTKVARVVELVRELAQSGNRALVFSQFTQFLAKVRVAFQEADLRVATLTGETPTIDRKAIIDAFQNGDYDVFCVSLLAGGTGLNLTKASYVIHLDPWWNPAVEEQATARAHRMGQTEPVTVYRLVARGTIEEAVLALHADKRQLASAVLEGKASPKPISSAELFELLRFGG